MSMAAVIVVYPVSTQPRVAVEVELNSATKASNATFMTLKATETSPKDPAKTASARPAPAGPAERLVTRDLTAKP